MQTGGCGGWGGNPSCALIGQTPCVTGQTPCLTGWLQLVFISAVASSALQPLGILLVLQREIDPLLLDQISSLGCSSSPACACRGAALEVLLSKLMAAKCTAQIVCMSATMAGLEPMADWLNARLFLTNFRCAVLCCAALRCAVLCALCHSTCTRPSLLRANPNNNAAPCAPCTPSLPPRTRFRHRPVPLSEHAVFQGAVFSCKKLTPEGEIPAVKRSL